MFRSIYSLPWHSAFRTRQTQQYGRLVRIVLISNINESNTKFLHRHADSCHGLTFTKYYSSKGKLHSILREMPKLVERKELQDQRRARKKKVCKYPPSTVYLQVIGSGAPGAPRSLFVITDHSRFLFNCGEGTQRLSQEHKVKLVNTENILVTHKSWENVGGLPGVLLTLQDTGVPEITMHGPPGIDSLYYDTRHFMKFRDLTITYRDFEKNGGKIGEGNDSLHIQCVPLWAKSAESFADSSDEHSCSESETEVEDLFAHEKRFPRKKSPQSDDDTEASKMEAQHRSKKCKNLSVAYICRPPPKAGVLKLEKCVMAGVPPGPLLGQLKSGKDVTLPNGNIVRAADVTSPDDPGPVFIVVEAPTNDYLDALLENEAFTQHQSSATCTSDQAEVVVHFTPSTVMSESRYQEWMARFPPSTSHISINDASSCMGSVSVHRMQYKLNHLSHSIFPLLKDNSIPIKETKISEEEYNSIPIKDTKAVKEVKGNGEKVAEDRTDGSCVSEDDRNNVSKSTNVLSLNSSVGSTCQATSLLTYNIRPKKLLIRSNDLTLEPQSYIQECYQNDQFDTLLKEAKSKIEGVLSENDGMKNSMEEYPNVVFLGTGSMIPNKTRNTSGILLNVSSDKSIMLDCAEGTYGQLVRLLGVAESDEALRKLSAVYVSHLHADHHLGLIRIIQARRRAYQRAGIDQVPKLLLLAPSTILAYLSSYHTNFESICNDFTLIGNHTLLTNDFRMEKEHYEKICSELDMKAIEMTYVIHCYNSFGVAWTHRDGWKMVYSGDTMPCQRLIDIGKDCDLLIHEATMEDELEEDAQMKAHSTTSQAIQVGQNMNAKFIVLTHFSQRYTKVPLIKDFPVQVGVAFDNMRVSFKALPTLHLLNDALVAMFAEYYDMMLEKNAKKRLARERQEKELENQANSNDTPAAKQRKIE